MGFSSYSDLVNKITNSGYYYPSVFYKVTSNGGAGTAGRWYEMYTATGTPPAGLLATTAGSSTSLCGNAGPPQSNQGMYFGTVAVAPSSQTRHILSVNIYTPTSTVVPATAILCDFLVGTALCTAGVTPSTITTAGLPRYTNGIGVQLIAATSVAFGATSPVITPTCTYDDNTNAAGGALTAPGASQPIASLCQSNGQPFMPLPAGKLGVKSVNSYTISSQLTGQFSFFLVKPLLTIPLIQQYVAVERDCVVQLPSFPQVYDGAYLAWIICPGGAMVASSVISGMVGVGWG